MSVSINQDDSKVNVGRDTRIRRLPGESRDEIIRLFVEVFYDYPLMRYLLRGDSRDCSIAAYGILVESLSG